MTWRHYLQASLMAVSLGLVVQQAQADNPEPEVTIRQEQGRTVEEYRINGQLYAIKIIPKNGEPYYLVDSDGSGQFSQDKRHELKIPSWVIFEW